MEYLRISLRVVMTFGVLLVFARLAGKKQISQLTFFDFITAIAIGDIAGEKLSDPSHPLLPWLGATLLWLGMAIGLDLLVLKNRPIAKLIEGEPTVVMENGRIFERRLKKNFLRVDGLLALLRGKGYFNPDDVEFAIFETDGTVSVMPRSQVRPITPKDMQIATSYEGLSRELIFEGQVNKINLRDMGLDEPWLDGELARLGYPDRTQIFYAALDTSGQLYVDSHQDPIDGSQVNVKDY